VNYYNNGCLAESEQVLKLAPANALVNYWLAFLKYKTGKGFRAELDKANSASPSFIFPFRFEDESVLLWAISQDNSWKPKYYLALLYKDRNRIDESKKLFISCGNEPQFAPFFAARAAMLIGKTDLTDLQKAVELDKQEWRYTKLLTEYYITNNQPQSALQTVEPFYLSHSDNYIMGILYAKALLLNKRYKQCSQLLIKIDILPFEGATIGRELYREAELMQAVDNIKLKNYTASLNFVNAAKQWPQNLGVGKPYDNNLDERLEDWIGYLCYSNLGNNKNAQTSLQAIIGFTPKIENTVSNFLPANDLVTSWAIEKLNGQAVATAWLDSQIKQYPGNKIVQWCRQVFTKEKGAAADISDSNVRILERLMQ